MQRLRAIWAGGWIGKVAIIGGGVMGLLVVCCARTLALGSIISRNVPAASSTAAPTIQAQAPTEVPTAVPTTAPTATPFPSVMSVSTIVAVQPTRAAVIEPTAEPSSEGRYLEIARDGAIATARVDFPAGEWKATVLDLGEGSQVQITFPMSVGLSNEQTVRLGKIQTAGIAKRLFDADPALAVVNVIGTLPDGVNNEELPAISIFVTRAEFERWDGTAETLGNWNVSPRLR